MNQQDQLYVAQCLLSRARRKSKDLERIVAKYPETPITGSLREDIERSTRLALELQREQKLCAHCGDLGYVMVSRLGETIGTAPCPNECEAA